MPIAHRRYVYCTVTIQLQSDARGPHGQHPRRKSFTPSMRRERPQLRSSPLAGASYSADGAGNVVQHTSALEEEISRRRSMLPGINAEDLARLAALPPSTPALSYSSSTNPSRQGSMEIALEPQTPRRARPSFISLAPQNSSESLVPPTPTSPTLRARHSSPHLAVVAKPSPIDPSPGPGPANWMTAAPAPSFSRIGVRGSGVVLPVKASSRAGEQIRLRSNPNRPAAIAATSSTQLQPPTKSRSLKSFRSMNRIIRGNTEAEDKEAPAVPISLSPPNPQLRANSFESKVSHREAQYDKPTLHLSVPVAPSDSIRSEQQSVPTTANSSRFSEDAEVGVVGLVEGQSKLGDKAGEGRVRRLWSKVRKWRAHS
ncbi:hypothetical protein BN14_08218 [Rhizoctonia solani AG-1 IB]|uniref:Uncharacterized protein n=1 Tax=Thanatephorus cucumeris (strain AG1-IB / isolate 7/3/14) TaxID=1108050 RepID=M5C3Z4_THACB|nr:hypothetical protein BN14_08218 [Rhizoctonia solani AG-1 IB]